MPPDARKVLLVYPRFFADSFWSLRETCEALSARYPAAPLGLITVAALLPKHWHVRLINRNTTTLEAADLDWADIVMTGGMLVQQPDTLMIIDLCKIRGKPVVVGGPDVTSTPHLYRSADFQVLGEAELVMDQFIEAWTSGATHGVFEAEKFTADVSRSPTPRFDLLAFSDYMYIGVQFSRGCPFNCEFCDIIELYGRVPRAKTIPQMLAELDALHARGFRGHVDFVDDNLIGNKKALKQFLPALIAWQQEHGYPFKFSTEASINLADDDRLLALMRDANFFAVFVGIESPDTDTLIAMQKKQNTRRSLAASVHKIYEAGMFVIAGFILGFDNEKGSIAEPMIDCIEATAIPGCMVGLLYALPTTQLTRRLAREQRLYEGYDYTGLPIGGDQCSSGLNFATARPRRDILTDYRQVLERIYCPRAYFGRARRVARMLRTGAHVPPPLPPGPDHRQIPASGKITRGDLRWAWCLVRYIALRQPRLLWHFWSAVLDCARHNPAGMPGLLSLTALYLHLGPFAREVTDQLTRQIAVIDDGRWRTPPLTPATEPRHAPRRPAVASVAS